MKMIFDKQKTYQLTIFRNGKELGFTASEVETIGELLSFKDKFNNKLIFPLDALLQAQEVKT
jgi:hypothetical protein